MTAHRLSNLITQNSRKAAIGKGNKSEREVRGRGGGGGVWGTVGELENGIFFSLPTSI